MRTRQFCKWQLYSQSGEIAPMPCTIWVTRTQGKHSEKTLRGVEMRNVGLHLSIDFAHFQVGDELMLRQIKYCWNKCSLLVVTAIMMSPMLVLVVPVFVALVFD